MNVIFVIGAVMVFVIYSIALVLLGMGISNKFNRIAWDKFYEGRGDR